MNTKEVAIDGEAKHYIVSSQSPFKEGKGGCTGTFSGTGTVNDDTMTCIITGSDCSGTHENGQGTITKDGNGGGETSEVDKLMGTWYLYYTISTSDFDNTYTFTKDLTSSGSVVTNSEGQKFIMGAGEYGDTVITTYWPSMAKWTIFDEGGTLDRFFIFKTDGDNILDSSCYHHYAYSSQYLTSCYKLCGSKTSSGGVTSTGNTQVNVTQNTVFTTEDETVANEILKNNKEEGRFETAGITYDVSSVCYNCYCAGATLQVTITGGDPGGYSACTTACSNIGSSLISWSSCGGGGGGGGSCGSGQGQGTASSADKAAYEESRSVFQSEIP